MVVHRKASLGSTLIILFSVYFGTAFASKPPLFKASRNHRAPEPTLIPSVRNSKRDALVVRGGSDSDYDSSDDSGDDDVQIKDTCDDRGSLEMPKKILGLVGKLAFGTVKAFGRGLQAAFTKPEASSEPKGAVSRIFGTFSRMFTAAFFPSDEDGASSRSNREELKSNEQQRTTPSVSTNNDFGKYLSSTYDVEATRHGLDDVSPVLGGSLVEAMKTARSEARLLLILIPASKPGKLSADSTAIESFLSEEVAKVAERKARKSGAETGSFFLWSTKQGSSEAVAATKRLKAQPTGTKGQKRPILVAAYLAQVNDRNGFPRMVPRLLAQHHCSPPPDSATMAAWLNALRKRHAKQFVVMQKELKEQDLYKERKEGYKDSVQNDIERKERLAREEAERAAEEAAEKKRQEALKERRIELLESLPEEPDSSVSDAKTIALRFADGRVGRRRFEADTALQTVFDWVDGEFEMEREKIIFTTMNGKMSFSWEDKEGSLVEKGLSKMVGFRVAIAKESDADKEEDEE